MPKLQGPVGNTLKLMLLPVPTHSCLPWSGDKAACRALSASLQTFPNVSYNFSSIKNAPCMDLGTRNKFYQTRQWPAKRKRADGIASSFYRCVWSGFHTLVMKKITIWGMFSSQFTPTFNFWGPLQYLDLISRYLVILFLRNEAPHVGDWKA